MATPPPTPHRRVARALQRQLVRLGKGRLRGPLLLAYGALARAVGRRLVAPEPGAAVYLRGSLASAEAAPGLSDIDLVVVVEADRGKSATARLRVSARWDRAARAVPGLRRMVSVAVYEQPELAEAVRGPAPTYGLGEGRALFHRAEPLDDPLWLRTRPGLAGPTVDWRHLLGPERRLQPVARERQDERIAAWLELQWWWRHVISACREPTGAHTAHLLAKALAEAARVLVWLETGSRPATRRGALEAAQMDGGETPADLEIPALRAAIATLDTIAPAQLDLMVPALARLCDRVARRLALELQPSGTRQVRLVGSRPAGPAIPLMDWRALVLGERPSTLIVNPGKLGDPAAIRAVTSHAGGIGALREGELLLVAPEDVWATGFLRTLQCPLTDPVSFALLAGEPSAAFPAARGWSAEDWAERAVSEHRARLQMPSTSAGAALRLGVGAARAAGLVQSLQAGKPELALDTAAVLEQLEAAGGAPAGPASEVRSRTAVEPGSDIPDTSDSFVASAARALLEAVRELPPYGSQP